jgi:hypothetical protein
MAAMTLDHFYRVIHRPDGLIRMQREMHGRMDGDTAGHGISRSPKIGREATMARTKSS